MRGKREQRRTKKSRAGVWMLTALVLLAVSGVAAAEMPDCPPVPLTGPAEPAPGDAPAEPVPENVPAEPVPEDIPAEPEWAPVAESGAVEDDYFADAVFLGDSRTEGFSLYSGLKQGTYLYSVGATVESVFTKDVRQASGVQEPLLDTLAGVECGKVYIMLGVNELGWVYPEKFQEQYGKVVDRVRQDHPEAEIYIQSILPVSAGQEAKKSYVNNGRIALYNQLLEELAQEKACAYVNVAETVTGEDGCLREELTADGVHLNQEGCRQWLAYLRTHTVGEPAADEGNLEL